MHFTERSRLVCYCARLPFKIHTDKSPEALAKRIWMSFVPEGHFALTLADLKEVMGPALEVQAQECFHSLDRDDNGDVSLEEMVLHTVQLHSERRDVAKSMQDVVSTNA
jgi:Ca2+-binding EF-hand superfamily protein